ncbi:FmdB family zinc ribbon protein [Verrucomicrobium spinosum]|uniref:FmdB family zinc ribbon protein n=1 Tax=Verrucomicrobium spinosum TaxID=2736 RepID=UPI0001746B47|nr:FmdB family zinc ribbon protein [Verrucomicrobium spinosum]
MPTYEYECTTCGHQFETVQSMKDPHLKDCPQQECAGPVKRKIGRGAGLIFKGTGFYITDYRSDSYKAAAKQDSASSSSSSSSSSSGSSSTASSPSSGSSSSASSSTSPSPKAA